MAVHTKVSRTERARRGGHASAATRRPRGLDPTTNEIDYSHDELEFALAMQEYKQRTGRMFPTWRETLGVLRGLGYQKVPT